MYNKTVNLIKKTYLEKKQYLTNFKKIRTNYLKDYRNDIQKGSSINGDEKTEIKIHTLDYAIKLACANYKSALTNLRNGNIKHFRVRYWRHNRKSSIIDFEKGSIKNNNICRLGKMKAFYNNNEVDLNINSDCRLQYNSILKQYKLFVPIKSKNNKKKVKKNKYVGIDIGIRTFITGVSNNEAIKVGQNVYNKLSIYIKRKNRINNNNNINKKIKKKTETLCYRKIRNLVDELHWKSIKYITDKYNKVFIGDISAKKIVNNKTSVITSQMKEVLLNLRIHVYRQRMEYKCRQQNTEYKLVDEKFTTKMCSKCGWINEKIGGNKIFNCKKCGMKEGRDINSGKIMCIKGQ